MVQLQATPRAPNAIFPPKRALAAMAVVLTIFASACTFDDTTQRSVSGAGIGAAAGAAGGALFGAMAGVPATGAAIGAAAGAAIGGVGGYIYDQQIKGDEKEAENERLRRENEALKKQQATP